MGRQEVAYCTHHFKPICKDVEIGIFLVALDDRGFHSFPCTLDENLGAIYRKKLDFLQLSNTPEQNLWWAEKHQLHKVGRESAVVCKQAGDIGWLKFGTLQKIIWETANAEHRLQGEGLHLLQPSPWAALRTCEGRQVPQAHSAMGAGPSGKPGLTRSLCWSQVEALPPLPSLRESLWSELITYILGSKCYIYIIPMD